MQRACLTLAALIGIVTLSLWLLSNAFPIPHGLWMQMKANSAVLALCSVFSLTLSPPNASRRMLLASRVLAAFVGAFSLAILLQYAFGLSFGIDTLLAADKTSLHPGRPSLQTAVAFLLLAPVLALIRRRKSLASHISDALCFGFCLWVLVLASSYLFGALHLHGVANDNRTAPQTLACLMLLAFVTFGRRAEEGVFAIFLGTGIGSTIARIVCPLALLTPFVVEVGQASVIAQGRVSAQSTTAIATAIASMLSLVVTLLLARKIDDLEKSIREMAVRDELTGLYNRRGFYMIAERELNMAQRAGQPFSVLFLDLDNLKQTNDQLGHEVGSEFLQEAAAVLKETFRKTDVLGRVGGDEFVIAFQSGPDDVHLFTQRLEEATLEKNHQSGRQYALQFSVGYATSFPADQRALEDLINDADAAMYEAKHQKKAAERYEVKPVLPLTAPAPAAIPQHP